MSNNDIILEALLTLLNEIRGAGLAVDVDKYVLIFKALDQGIGFDRALRQFVQALCVHNDLDVRAFEHHYARFQAQIDSVPDTVIPLSPPSRHEGDRRLQTLADSFKQVTNDLRKPTEAQKADQGAAPPLVDQIMRAVAAPEEVEAISTVDVAPSLRDAMPVSRRQMRQCWRYLRLPIREGVPVEFDVRATMARVARTGTVAHAIMRPRRVNRAEIALFVDIDGSMVPFHDLSRRLVETAMYGGGFHRVQAFYFHNVPGKLLVLDYGWTQAMPLQDFLHNLPRPGLLVAAIVSDAGAARRRRTVDRIEKTRAFLDILGNHGIRTVWLNPMPRERWRGTSAEDISRHAPMFEITKYGLEQAVRSLKRSSMQQVHNERLL